MSKTKRHKATVATGRQTVSKSEGRGGSDVTETQIASKTKRRAKEGMKPKTRLPSNFNGEAVRVLEPKSPVSPRLSTEKPQSTMKSNKNLASLCADLRELQRMRVVFMKSRIMLSNRVRALVAGASGYRSGLGEKERERLFKLAGNLIKEAIANPETSKIAPMVLVHQIAIDGLEREKMFYEKRLIKAAEKLPVVSWVLHPSQMGFGVKSLGIIISETGDLFNYANPAKVWRRMSCAPWTFDGQTLMGATWRSGKEGKLPAMEWESYGYNPRRRGIAYMIGEALVKQNQDGPYRARYDEAKLLAAQNHPEWLVCSRCEGTGKSRKGKKCSNCRGSGEVKMRCHLHGMLLATKLLLKNLWIEWTQ